MSSNLSPRVEQCQQKQKATHDGKKPPSTFMNREKVLVLNKRGKTKWLFGTIVQQKSPVTYLVKDQILSPRTFAAYSSRRYDR